MRGVVRAARVAWLCVALVVVVGVGDVRAQASVAAGDTWLAQGRYREAMANYDAVLQAYPNAVEAWVGRGKALNLLGDVGGAITSYTMALQRGGAAMPGVRAWIAELYLAAGNQPQAEAALADELRLAPQSAWAYSWLGTLRLLQGRDAEAAQAFAAAQWLDPQILAHRYGNGVGLFNAGQGGRAWMDFRSVVAINPDAAGAYYAMATIYRQAGMAQQAAQALQAYLQRDATSEWAQRARQELAGLTPQAPAANPAGYPGWMGSGANPPPPSIGEGPVSVAPGPGPATLPPAGSSGASGSPTGYSANQCPPETRTTDAAQLQRVMAAAYTEFVSATRSRGPNDPSVAQALKRYQCARETLQVLRQTTQPGPWR